MTHPILQRLADPDPEQRRSACRDAPDDPSAVLLLDALGEALGDSDWRVAQAASDALARLGQTQSEVKQVLRTALHSDSPKRRWGAAFTTARLEPPGEKLLPALVEALGFAEGNLRWTAARLMVETGRLSNQVLPLLLGLVRADGDPRTRRMATYCLRELAPDLPEAAAALLAATHERDVTLRRSALSALASLIDPPPAAVARLIEALTRETDAACRQISATALGEIGAANPGALPPDAFARLEDARAKSGDPPLQRAAASALVRLASPHP